MLAVALEEEVAAYIAAHTGELDEHGHRLVRRNGHARERVLTTGAGQLPVAAPRVDDRRVDPVAGTRARFRSVILPPWCRRSPKVAEVLPLAVPARDELRRFRPGAGRLLRGGGWAVSIGDHPADCPVAGRPGGIHGPQPGRSRLRLCRADGVHFNVRLQDARLCALVIVGVRSDGAKELVAVADGERESTQSWAELLRDLRRRGMQAPVLAVGDGALGLWAIDHPDESSPLD
jgi:putative transposase